MKKISNFWRKIKRTWIERTKRHINIRRIRIIEEINKFFGGIFDARRHLFSLTLYSIVIKEGDMKDKPFQIHNGQLYFDSDDQNQFMNSKYPLMQQQNFHLTTNNMSEPISIIKDDALEELGDNKQQQKPKTVIRAKTKKRNNQNSFRTILRSMKQILKMNYDIKIPKFYESCDYRYLLAILRKQNQLGRLKSIKQFLSSQFEEIIKKKRTYKKKDFKIKSILLHILQLTDQCFHIDNLQKTIYQFSILGQLKYHPVKKQKLSLEQFLKIQKLISLKNNNL